MSSGFWINFNPSANTVLNNLESVNNNMNKLSEVLSTGNSVNTAADNPAQYAISQNMIQESNGMNQAVQNSQQAVSMLQTATGAQQQIGSILQTMNNLATQAAQNSTMTFEDRAGLQLEMNSLSQEINSITNQTQYNGEYVLSGKFSSANTGSAVTLQVGANNGQTIQFNIAATDVNTLNVAGTQASSSSNYVSNTGVIVSGSGTAPTSTLASSTTTGISFGNDTLLQSGTYQVVFNGTYGSSGSVGTLSSGTLQLQVKDGSMWDNIGSAQSVSLTSANTTVTLGDSATGADLSFSFNGSYYTGSYNTGTTVITQTDQFNANGTGSTGGTLNNGWNASTNAVGLNIMTVNGAQNAITAIHTAISTVTAEQEQLGAVQNRLNYTISDLQNTSSNLQSANSVIVGANMAETQTQMTQSQILEQAGISVLSQAQQQPGMLLKLLS